MSLFDDILTRVGFAPRASLPAIETAMPTPLTGPGGERSTTERLFTAPVAPPKPAAPRANRSIAQAPPAGESIFRRMARRADSIVNALSGLGGQYDKGTTGRPDTQRMPLDFRELTALYRFNGYAQRFIDIVPNDATRKGWKIVDSTTLQDAMAEETKRLSIPARVKECLSWARLYGGCILLIVVDEEVPPQFAQNPGQLLQQPLDPTKVRRVLNLVPLDPSEAQPYSYESDLRSPRFKDVRTWLVSPNSNGVVSSMAGHQIVHHSRVLYFAGKRLPSTVRHANRGIDDSVLEAIWDQVRNRTSVDQAAALIAQELKLHVMKIKGLPALSTSDQAELLDMRMKMIAKSKSLNNMILLGDDEDFTTLATPMAGFDQLDSNSREALCAVTGMPAELLFGDAPGGLNTDGESHIRLWGQVISSFQQDRLLEGLTELYGILYASTEGPTGGRTPEAWSVEFRPLAELSEKQTAELRLMHAQTDQILVEKQILPAEHITKSRFGPTGYQNDILPFDYDAESARLEAEVARLQAAQAAAIAAGILPAPLGQEGAAEETQPTDGAFETPQQPQPVEIAAQPAAEDAFYGVPAPNFEAWMPPDDGGFEEAAALARGDAADIGPFTPMPGPVAVLAMLPDGALHQWLEEREKVESLLGALQHEGTPHVTVVYLGATAKDAVPGVVQSVAEEAAKSGAFPVRTGRLAAFPAADGLTPVVLLLAEAGELAAIHERLEATLFAGSNRAVHDFVPHLTLGYLASTKTKAIQAALDGIQPGPVGWSIEELVTTVSGQRVATAALGGA